MIRRAVNSDSARIAEIHIFGWRSAYRGIVSDEYLFTEILVSERIESFIQNNESEIHEIYVYEEEGIIKGFMKIGNCRNEDKVKAFELWGMYIEPLMKNQGIGRKLLSYCEDIAKTRGKNENVLWVFKDNIEARGFYEKMGYRTDGKEELMEKFNALEVRYIKILN